MWNISVIYDVNTVILLKATKTVNTFRDHTPRPRTQNTDIETNVTNVVTIIENGGSRLKIGPLMIGPSTRFRRVGNRRHNMQEQNRQVSHMLHEIKSFAIQIHIVNHWHFAANCGQRIGDHSYIGLGFYAARTCTQVL